MSQRIRRSRLGTLENEVDYCFGGFSFDLRHDSRTYIMPVMSMYTYVNNI